MAMRELLDLERSLASVLELSDLADGNLERLRCLMGASGATISCYDHGKARLPTIRGGSLESVMQAYPSELFAEDPIIIWNRRTAPGLFLARGDGFDIAAFTKSRAYLDFYKPNEIGLMCGVRPTGLPYGCPNMFGMMFSTPRISQPFAARAHEKMRELEVPLRAAAARIERFRTLQSKQDVLTQLLERQRGSYVLWDAGGRVTWISAEAQRQLSGPLTRSDLDHTAALALRQLSRADVPKRDALLGRPQLLRSADGAPLLVELSWIADKDRRPWLLAELRKGGGARALLVNLTPSELRVLRLLAQGQSNREISEVFAVSLETVRTHVKRILAKLNVSTRAKAARLAVEAWQRSGVSAGDDPRPPREASWFHCSRASHALRARLAASRREPTPR